MEKNQPPENSSIMSLGRPVTHSLQGLNDGSEKGFSRDLTWTASPG